MSGPLGVVASPTAGAGVDPDSGLGCSAACWEVSCRGRIGGGASCSTPRDSGLSSTGGANPGSGAVGTGGGGSDWRQPWAQVGARWLPRRTAGIGSPRLSDRCGGGRGGHERGGEQGQSPQAERDRTPARPRATLSAGRLGPLG